MPLKILLLVSFSLAPWAFPKEKSAPKYSTKEVDQVLASYRQGRTISANVKKTVAQEAIGTETKSNGKFYFSKGKLRMDIAEPEKTTLVYDGRYVWFETRLDDTHVNVTKMHANQLRKSDSILAALFDKKDVLKNFKLVSRTADGSSKVFGFEARDKKKSDIQFMEIALKGADIEHISYKDQVENKVTLEFSGASKQKMPGNKFVYKPPKGAEISEF